MIICVKGTSDEFFLLDVNVNVSLISFEHIESSQRTLGTWTLRAFRHLGTQTLIGHSGT